MCSQHEDFGNLVAKSIKAFTREQTFFSKEFSTINFVFEDKEEKFLPLNAEIFEALQYIVKKQNFLFKEENKSKLKYLLDR